MDDDDDRDFSKGIVYGFFEQADGTFEKMEKAMYAIQQLVHNYLRNKTNIQQEPRRPQRAVSIRPFPQGLISHSRPHQSQGSM